MIERIKNLTSGHNTAILLCFFFGHAVFHFMAQSFSVLLPSIQETFTVTPIQIGALITTREIVTAISGLPGGILAEYFHKYRSYLLNGCLVVFTIGWLLVALAPRFGVLFVAMVFIAVAIAVWHLPSLVELGRRYPSHRGTVFAIHGAGGTTGDILGPMLTGLLLTSISWRTIIASYLLLPLGIALWTFFVYRRNTIKEPPLAESEQKRAPVFSSLREQLKVSREILKTTHMWRVTIVAGFRGMCFTVMLTFLPLYMHDKGFSPSSIGFHFGLLWALGLVMSPLMGYLSDRFGRKIVLVPALLYSSTLVASLAFCEQGPLFTLVIIMLGLSIRSDYSLVNATIIDIVRNRAETTMLGVLSLVRHLMGASAPIIAGFLYQFVGIQTPFLFVAALFLISALIFSTVNIYK